MEEEEEWVSAAPAGFQFDRQAVREILRLLRALPAAEQADTLSLVIRRFFDLAEREQREIERESRRDDAEGRNETQ